MSNIDSHPSRSATDSAIVDIGFSEGNFHYILLTNYNCTIQVLSVLAVRYHLPILPELILRLSGKCALCVRTACKPPGSGVATETRRGHAAWRPGELSLHIIFSLPHYFHSFWLIFFSFSPFSSFLPQLRLCLSGRPWMYLRVFWHLQKSILSLLQRSE